MPSGRAAGCAQPSPALGAAGRTFSSQEETLTFSPASALVCPHENSATPALVRGAGLESCVRGRVFSVSVP